VARRRRPVRVGRSGVSGLSALGGPEFANALVLVAWFGVPLTTLTTVAGIFPPGGARAGGIGLGVLAVLVVTLLALGQ
jgi:hypothetical protein